MRDLWSALRGRWHAWQAARRERRQALRNLASPGEARLAALRVLRHHRLGPSEIQRVAACLDDPDPFVRWEAAETLAAQGGSHVLGVCLRRVQGGEPAHGIAAAVRVLAALRDERAVPVLLSLLHHPDVEVRVNLVIALAAFPERPEVQAGLEALLHDPHLAVRRAAIWALRRLDADWATQALARRAAEETHPWLQRLCVGQEVQTETTP